MTTIANIDVENPRGQCIIMLLAALNELHGTNSKQETIAFIRERHWFDIHPEDLLPYPSCCTNEPRWQTLIAWGRKDSVVAGLMFDHRRDEWELTRDGIDRFTGLRARYRTGELFAGHSFLWSSGFKQWMSPSYVPSVRDWSGPGSIYRDLGSIPHRNVRTRVLLAQL